MNKITRKKIIKNMFFRFSFVSERFSTIWIKNQNGSFFGGEGGCRSLTRTEPRRAWMKGRRWDEGGMVEDGNMEWEEWGKEGGYGC